MGRRETAGSLRIACTCRKDALLLRVWSRKGMHCWRKMPQQGSDQWSEGIALQESKRNWGYWNQNGLSKGYFLTFASHLVLVGVDWDPQQRLCRHGRKGRKMPKVSQQTPAKSLAASGENLQNHWRYCPSRASCATLHIMFDADLLTCYWRIS